MGDINEELIFNIAGVASVVNYPKLRRMLNTDPGFTLVTFEYLAVDLL